jgi:hypothetical protein
MAFLAGVAATLAFFTIVFLGLLWRAPLMDDDGKFVRDNAGDRLPQKSTPVIRI